GDVGPRLRVRQPSADDVANERLRAALEQLDAVPDSELGDEAAREQKRQMRAFLQNQKRGDVVFEMEARLDVPVVQDGFAASEYLVAVEIGDPWKPLVLGESKAKVEIDQTEQVVVHVEP